MIKVISYLIDSMLNSSVHSYAIITLVNNTIERSKTSSVKTSVIQFRNS